MMTRALLDIGYIFYVVPYFGYSGFNLNVYFFQYLLSWCAFLMALIITPVEFSKPSDVIFMMVTATVVAPLTSMYGLSGRQFFPVGFSLLSFFYIWFVVNIKSLLPVGIPYVKNGERVAVIFCLVFVFCIFLHYLSSGVHLSLSILKVYDFRELNSDLAGGGLFGYLNSWAYEIFNIFLLAVCLMRKNFLWASVVVLVQIFFFAASQHKSVLFYPFLLLGFWWYFRRKNSLYIMPVAICIVLITSLLVFYFYNNVIISSLFLRRVFFTPAQLSFEYYDFFSEHPKVFWGDSWWMPFVQSPYSVTIPYIIGTALGRSDMGANNGFVSSGFAQAGVLGIFIYSSIIGLILRFVDKESIKLDVKWLGAGLFLIPLMTTWRSADLATSMMTHGLLLMIILLSLLRRPQTKV